MYLISINKGTGSWLEFGEIVLPTMEGEQEYYTYTYPFYNRGERQWKEWKVKDTQHKAY